MPYRGLTLLLCWIGTLLLGLTAESARAQTRPATALPDSVVQEPAPADSLVKEPPARPVSALPDSLRRPARLAPELTNFAYVDSLSAQLLARGRWRSLDSLGRRALAAGTDFPLLRRRLGYAAALQQRPAAAIGHYEHALRENADDTLSRLGLTLAWLTLNQRETAAWYARRLSASTQRNLHLTPRALARFEAELSGQVPTSRGRNAAGFGRVGIGSQLGRGITLTQAVSYYGQQVRYGLPPTSPLPPGTRPEPSLLPARQSDYQALLSAPLSAHLLARTGYHFVHSRFGDNRYPGYLAHGTLRYARPYWQLQASLYAGRLTDTARTQTELQLTLYPQGTLNLYGFGRAIFVRSGGRTFPHPVLGAGARLAPRLWAEAYAGWGFVPVLADQDGAYVYNLLDPLRRRFGLSLLTALPGGYWQARLHYGAEARTQIQTLTFYTQHTLTAALTWTW